MLYEKNLPFWKQTPNLLQLGTNNGLKLRPDINDN